ncbi:acyltransferase [Actinomadura sp. ATCC 31491]|uniref:Acyltransferase n=1 Tax=Actinomadura luzonensis TaxID=2805427 RepID=A0ABT0G940_9ACTN|nr:acyltransferase [Actinomadura luzonensis]MCK2221106.1 acyltransferase [Actinomadura luzonensis]
MIDASPARPPGPANYILSLTGLRGVLAIVVFGNHFLGLNLTFDEKATRQSAGHGLLEALFANATVAVSAFFILSGFVLTWIAGPDDTVRRFYRRRFAKVYPIHLITTLVALALLVAAFGWPAWTVVAQHLLLLHAWVPSEFSYFGLNGVTWSLSCEAFFYLCFPALLAVLNRARTGALYATVAGCVASVFVVPYLVSGVFVVTRPDPFEMVPTSVTGGPFLYWFVHVFPLMRLPEFVVGIALALLVKQGRWRGPNLPASLVICVAGWELNNLLPGYLHVIAGMLIPWTLLVPALATADLSAARSPLRWGPLVWLGELSFSFYASHLIVQEQIVGRIGEWLHGLGWVPAAGPWHWYQWVPFMLLDFAIALPVAWMLFRLVELPAQRLLRPRGARPVAVPAPAVAPSLSQGM